MDTTKPAATAPKPKATSPAEQLFDRKIKLLEHLKCSGLIEEIETLDQSLVGRLHEQAALTVLLTGAQAELADAEAIVMLSVEGRNDLERKGRAAQARVGDLACQAATQHAHTLEGQIATLNVEIKSLERRIRRAERQVDYRVACLRYLGG